MKFRTKDLAKYLKKKVDWQKIAEELTLKSFETIYSDGILEADILPNRYADAGSIFGLVKEIKIVIGQDFHLKLKKPKEAKFKTEEKIKVINKTPSNAPYYFGRVILGIENKESPAWLKEFVEFYGFNSINFLVDLANFVMIEFGAPLHIFDLDKIEGNIFVRLAKRCEKFISLENKEYLLNGGEILIADGKKILALAGIKGGKTAEVTLETKNIFIEAAIFNPEKIYETSRKLNLKTEASFRFERKVAPGRSLQALERISCLIQENLGGEVLKGVLGYQKIKPKKLKFDFEKVNKIYGFQISKKEILKILKLLNIKQEKEYLVLPEDRLDLNNEEDIIEEVIRIYGWNKIKSQFEVILKDNFVAEEIKFNYYLRKFLTRLGYNEAYNYNFFGDKEREVFEKYVNQKPVEVLNPISENYKYFQFSLIPSLLRAVYLNQFNFKEIRLFEIEKIAFSNENIQEKYSLGIVFAYKNREEILKELKGVLRKILEELQINFKLKEKRDELFTEIFSQKEKLGFLGLLSLEDLEKLSLDLYVGFLELDIEKLRELKKEKKFTSWPVFPGISRDLSFFVDENIKFSQIEKEIKKLKINYLEKVELLDIYFPKNLKTKSFTLRLKFQNPERSLKEEEIENEMNKLQNLLREKFKAQLR